MSASSPIQFVACRNKPQNHTCQAQQKHIPPTTCSRWIIENTHPPPRSVPFVIESAPKKTARQVADGQIPHSGSIAPADLRNEPISARRGRLRWFDGRRTRRCKAHPARPAWCHPPRRRPPPQAQPGQSRRLPLAGSPMARWARSSRRPTARATRMRRPRHLPTAALVVPKPRPGRASRDEGLGNLEEGGSGPALLDLV